MTGTSKPRTAIPLGRHTCDTKFVLCCAVLCAGIDFAGRYRNFEAKGTTLEEQLSPLCEAPLAELQDTVCQDEWNTPECLYDRGACCYETCTSVNATIDILGFGDCEYTTLCRDPAIIGTVAKLFEWLHLPAAVL